jgi:RHS repeat-associated protein
MADKSIGSTLVAHRFTGYEWDEENGLYYAESIYYDPFIAQFLSPDPKVPSAFDAQAYNRYAYGRNNPTTYADPNGQFFVVVAIIVGAAVGGTVAGIQSHGDLAAIFKGAIIGGAAGGVGAWAGGAVGGGFAGHVVGGAAAGATSGGLQAAFASENILKIVFVGPPTERLGVQ